MGLLQDLCISPRILPIVLDDFYGNIFELIKLHFGPEVEEENEIAGTFFPVLCSYWA